jgi:hypothetical protein
VNGANYGLVMQCDEDELIGVKQQPPDCEGKHGLPLLQENSFLIAHSLAGYRKYGFSGLMMPFGYLREKSNDRAEVGFAYFAYPSASGREVHEYPFDSLFDHQLGHGFTIMMVSFMRALGGSLQTLDMSIPPYIGLDVRRRLQLGSLHFGFIVLGPHIICIKTKIMEEDPAWGVLCSTGIAEVFHFPCLGFAIEKKDLRVAKPDSE